MSGGERKAGGEAGGARLLRLARRELLDGVLPALDGDERYRARLIANAMKIVARELESGAAFAEATARDVETFASSALGETPADGPKAIRDALRGGHLDASPDLHELLRRLTERRRGLLG